MKTLLSALELTLGLSFIQLFVTLFPYLFLRKKQLNIIRKLLFFTFRDYLFATIYLFVFTYFAKLFEWFEGDWTIQNAPLFFIGLLIINGYFFIVHPFVLKYDKRRLTFSPEYSATLSENLQKKVSVYITNNDTINAFATGFLPQNRVIVMGRGLIEKLTQEEREAILYHEVGHHKHYDLIKFYFVVVLQCILLGCFRQPFADLVHQFYPSFNDGNLIFWYGCLIGLFYIIIFSKISHYAEYQADQYGAQHTSNQAMGNALLKLSELTEHIVDQGSMTHPSIEKRLANIQFQVLPAPSS